MQVLGSDLVERVFERRFVLVQLDGRSFRILLLGITGRQSSLK